MENAKNCLKKIGKALIPTWKGPRPIIDRDVLAALYYVLRRLFKEAKKQLRRKQLNWEELYERYSLALDTLRPNCKILVKKDDLVAELTGGKEDNRNRPSVIALNCLSSELKINTETLRTNLKRRNANP